MKKYLFAMMACAALLLNSCTSVRKTATMAPVANHVEAYPTVTDLEVMDKVEVSTTWHFKFFGVNQPLQQIKGNFVAETLKAAGADVLLEPQFVYTKKGFFGQRKLTVIGFPAKYKGFRKATAEDIEALKAVQCQPANCPIVYNTGKGHACVVKK